MFTLHTHHEMPVDSDRRQGMVLIVVLVVIVLLSLGAYTFSEFMVIETRAAAFNGKAVQARALADSGVEFVSIILGDRASLPTVGLYHNPSLFQGHLILNSQQAGGRGRFTVVAPVEGDITARQIRFGLVDESSKLNPNTITALVPAKPPEPAPNADPMTDTETLPNPLMGIPGMTLEISEAIFDWIDEDDEQRTYGAENEYYQSLAPPYESKNGKLETLDELLLIRGITPQILFGEDANRNGLLDPNENDGAQTAPFDNADSILDRGWSAYLTVYSRELNLQADRSSRIDINSNTLSDVYDKIEDLYDEETAKFVVAYRLNGPIAETESPDDQNPNSNSDSRGDSNRSTNAQSRGSSSASGNGANLQNAAQALGQAVAGRSGQVTRGGMDLTKGGKFQINSIYDLVGVRVQVPSNGTTAPMDSPWPNEPAAMETYLPDLMDKLGTKGSEQFIEGRININQAHKEVLLGLPGMTDDIAQRIVSAQLRGSNGEPLPESENSRATTMWLLAEGIVDLPTLRKLDPFITGRGDVFRMQVMGHFDGGGPVVRVEAVIDGTQNPPQAIFFRDLTDLGRGYQLPAMAR